MYKKPAHTGKSMIGQMIGTATPSGALAIWHLGQEGMAVKGGGITCYIDPYLTDSINALRPGRFVRAFDSPIVPSDVTNADLVLATHDHGDHLDTATLKEIAVHSPHALFICPAPAAHKLEALGIAEERVIPARAGEAIERPGIRITPIQAKHEEFETDADGNHRYLGYIMHLNGVTLYHAGDTVGFPELPLLLEPHRVEVACLPINGRDWRRGAMGIKGNLNYREAADVVQAIGADLFLPMHHDLFPFNSENPAYLVDYLHKEMPGQKYKVMMPGERLLYMSELTGAERA